MISRSLILFLIEKIKVFIHDIKQSSSVNNELIINEKILLCSLVLLFFMITSDSNAAIIDIAHMKGLTAQVKTEIQGSILNLILNAVGVATAMLALITSRWTILLFGIAYLVFVNGYFGYINGAFK